MIDSLLILYAGLVILCISIFFILFYIAFLEKKRIKRIILENNKELQDKIIDSLHNFIFGNCIFCGKEHEYIIEIYIEELNKDIEIRLCKECYQIREENEELHPDQDKIIETLSNENNSCPKCASREIGFDFTKTIWNCNDCGFTWEGFIKDL
jgi:hypothetical protein